MSTFAAPYRLKLHGTGRALPGESISTELLLQHLERHLDRRAMRTAGVIARRLGIRTRHLGRDLEQTNGQLVPGNEAPELCRRALLDALAEPDADINDIDYLIGHTTSPHTLLPPNIAWVSEAMNFAAPYMELRQACTGFANALQVAGAMLHAGALQRTAIVGSETGSPYFTADSKFASTEQLINYVQMGDGAGAVILGPDDGSERGIISDLYIGHIGNGKAPGLSLRGGGSGAPYCEQALPVFEHRADAVRQSGVRLFELGVEAVAARGHALGDFKRIIPHQANGRMAQPLATHFNIQPDQIHVTADRYGNLGSAAIWVAFDDLRRSDVLEPGDKVLVLGAEATKFLYGGFVYTH